MLDAQKRNGGEGRRSFAIPAGSLGSQAFRRRHGVRLAYVAGSMYHAISSAEMVIALGQAGLLGFFGTGGLRPAQVEEAIIRIRQALPEGAPWGMNLLHDEMHPEREAEMVELFLRRGVRCIEASAFTYITAPLVKYLAAGLSRDSAGRVAVSHHIMAKLSRPEVAAAFLSPAPSDLVELLLAQGAITPLQAELLSAVPMAGDICVEADSGGHTDGGAGPALWPAMLHLRDEFMAQHGYTTQVQLGMAGGIGAPESAAAAFLMGADFILTGSINQCTVEAGTSAAVKEMLQVAGIQDTTYAPAADLFESGAKVQVFRRGVLFPSRANRLYSIYCHYDCIGEIPANIRRDLEANYFRSTLDDVFEDVCARRPAAFRHTGQTPKQKMALIFRTYLGLSAKYAIRGIPGRRLDYQIHCGPAMGAFNQWVNGTTLEAWENRRVADIGERLMNAAAAFLSERLGVLGGGGS